MRKLFAVAVAMAAFPVLAHPYPQPRPEMSTQTSDATTTYVNTGTSPLPVFQNQLAYVQSNLFDGYGLEMPNTLPSTPSTQFNLHDGPVQITAIDATSPTDDLKASLNTVLKAAQNGIVDQASIQNGLDILEGNPIAGKTYSGFAVLHYTAGERVKAVTPIYDAAGTLIGGNVDVHQIWYDNHVECDTALLDISAVKTVPWTVTYTIDVLNAGADDFSPFVMYWDDPTLSMPGMPPMPHVAMDATFYPMSDGKRHVIKLKHAPGKYYNLTYSWGWRIHPPRVQAMENAGKKVGTNPDGSPKTLVQWETSVFGTNPRSSEAAKLAAIAKLGDLAPDKRMWQALRSAKTATTSQVVALIQDALISYSDWTDRTRLPRGVTADPNADVTLFFVGNTIYGNAKTFNNWKGRGSVFKATLLNGDNFDHAYINVDFGGSRGWEPQFQYGSGPGGSHTFGRVHWWMNTAFPLDSITIPAPAAGGAPTQRKVQITLNYDSPERITLYQFDPLHHDVAVYSLH